MANWTSCMCPMFCAMLYSTLTVGSQELVNVPSDDVLDDGAFNSQTFGVIQYGYMMKGYFDKMLLEARNQTCPYIFNHDERDVADAWCFYPRTTDALMFLNQRDEVLSMRIACRRKPARTHVTESPDPDRTGADVPEVTCPCTTVEITKSQAIVKGPCKHYEMRLSKVGYLPKLELLILHGVIIIDLSLIDLQYFPRLSTFIVYEVPLQRMDKGLFCNMTVLRAFALYRSSLQKFPSHIFECGQTLNIEYMELVDNTFPVLPANALKQAANSVFYLFLANNRIQFVSNGAFRNANNLKFLVLRNNPIFSLPSDLLHSIKPLLYFEHSEDVQFNFWNTSLVPNTTEVFILSFTSTNSIAQPICENTDTKLLFINITHNNISTIVPQAFSNCKAVRYLHASHNALLAFDTTSFPSSVEILSLDHNLLSESLEWGNSFRTMSKLKLLNISYNSLQNWNTTFGESLIWLDMSHNYVQYITDPIFMKNSLLQLIDLSYNRLKILPKDLFINATSVLTLKLNNNILKALDLDLNACFQLHHMNISYNMLESFNLSVTSPLEIIDLAYNKLTVCPIIEKFESLHALNVSYNMMIDFSGCFDSMLVGSLIASHNYAENVSIALYTPTALRISLDASHNRILNFMLNCTEHALFGVLNASHNSLTSFSESLGDHNSGCDISIIDFSYNPIERLHPSEKWSTVPLLQYKKHKIDQLIFQNCNISVIEPLTFQFFDFKELDLQNNKLKSILYVIDVTTAGIPFIYLYGNPIVCNCYVPKISVSKTAHFLLDFCVYHSDYVEIKSQPASSFVCEITCNNLDWHDTCPTVYCMTYESDSDVLDEVSCKGNGNKSFSCIALDVKPINHRFTFTGFDVQNVCFIAPCRKDTRLEYLTMHNNSFQNISPNAFVCLGQLFSLDLSFNLIERIEDNAFTGLENLQRLFLDSNKIYFISRQAFNPLISLVCIHLGSNLLTTLNVEVINVFRHLALMKFDENPWRCQCNRKLVEFMYVKRKQIMNIENITCNDTNESILWFNQTCDVDTSSHVPVRMQLVKILPSVLLILLLVVVVFTVLFRRQIQAVISVRAPGLYHLFSRNRVIQNDLLYDIFVGYNPCNDDADTWFRNHLDPFLTPRYSIIHYDSLDPSRSLYEQLASAVERSRCAVLLLTEDFFSDPTASYMFEMCQEGRTHLEGFNLVLVLLQGVHARHLIRQEDTPADLRVKLRSKDFLKVSWTLFWDRLQHQLPSVQEENDLTNGEIENVPIEPLVDVPL